MRTVKILERAIIGASPSQVAQEMSRSESIGRFPGVVRAFAGQAGIRVDLNLANPPLRDSVVIAWWAPQIQDTTRTYRFGLEGGSWLNGIGRVEMHETGPDETHVTLLWEIDLATPLAFIPGFSWCFSRRLSGSTRVWLGRMKWTLDSANRRRMPPLTLADVGA